MSACGSIRARVINSIRKREGLVHLQGTGEHHGIPAECLQVGDVTLWNYDLHGWIVTETKPRAATCIDIQHKNLEDGAVYPRTLKRGRLVAVNDETYRRYLERTKQE